jgi:hypothetical protein
VFVPQQPVFLQHSKVHLNDVLRFVTCWIECLEPSRSVLVLQGCTMLPGIMNNEAALHGMAAATAKTLLNQQ